MLAQQFGKDRSNSIVVSIRTLIVSPMYDVVRPSHVLGGLPFNLLLVTQP